MSLINIKICGEHIDQNRFDILNKKLDNIMASIQQLSAEVAQLREQTTDLQNTLDQEQQQIQEAIDALNTSIQQLQQQLTDGGTVEERQALLDSITGVRNDLTALKTDLSGTVADTQEPGTDV